MVSTNIADLYKNQKAYKREQQCNNWQVITIKRKKPIFYLSPQPFVIFFKSPVGEEQNGERTGRGLFSAIDLDDRFFIRNHSEVLSRLSDA